MQKLNGLAKRLLLIVSLTLAVSATAMADAVTVTGDTFRAPDGNFNRPLENGAGLSPTATNVSFTVIRLSVSATGSYTFGLTSQEPEIIPFLNFDPFLILYQNQFNPSNPLANFLRANDDLSMTNFNSGFTANLSVGVNYFVVVTGTSNFSYGLYSLAITGPGIITAIPTQTAAIPEPMTLVLLGTGLCGLVANRRRQGKSQNHNARN